VPLVKMRDATWLFRHAAEAAAAAARAKKPWAEAGAGDKEGYREGDIEGVDVAAAARAYTRPLFSST